jgi:predicted nucleic acid-binding protein
MVLVDTAIWVDHIRRPEIGLVRLLESESVLVHPFVVGEIALGSMKNLSRFIALLSKLPKSVVARPTEVLELIKNGNLAGFGIGYVDTHLIASTLLVPGTSLWTRDKRLKTVAQRFSIAADL